MKKTFYTILITLTLSLVLTESRAQYSFSTFNEPFVFLTNPDTLTIGIDDWDDNLFYIPIGFPVNAYGSTYDSLIVETNGDVFLLGGTAVNSDTLPLFFAFWTDLWFRALGESPISYQLTGTAGSRIAKIEWRNAAIFTDPNIQKDSISFQVWIYETTGDVEYRYGGNQVNLASYDGQTGSVMGFTTMDLNSSIFIGGSFLSGNATNPQLDTLFGQITGTPAENTVYKFTNTLSIPVPEQVSSIKLSVYPNPVHDRLNLSFSSTGESQITIQDVTGRLLVDEMTTETGSVNKEINVNQLAPGLYFVSVRQGENTTIQKIMVK